MDVSEKLRCLFTARIEERDGNYVVDIPDRELDLGDVESGGTYRVAVLEGPRAATEDDGADEEPDREREPDPHPGTQKPPVEEGETRKVEIEDIGEQGDGIARVERGFVIIVPDSEMGARLTVEITDVKDTVAFANVVERISYYD